MEYLQTTALEQKTKEFFESGFRKDGTYNAQLLIVCGILMAKGTPLEKAPVLFDTLDTEKKKSIETQVLDAFVENFTALVDEILMDYSI